MCEKHRTELEEALAAHTPKKKIVAVLPAKDLAAHLTRRTASINLFGRMLAELPAGHVEAAVHGPRLLRTPQRPATRLLHRGRRPPPGRRPGSAHLQTAFLTTSLFYRFATINITDLHHNLGSATPADTVNDLVELFVRHFILSMPRGKKTSTAPHTVPDLVHYTVRDRRSVSYGAAFEQPVKAAPQGGYTAPARQALTDYAATISRLLGTRHLVAHGHTTTTKPIKALGTHHTSFDDLAAACATAATNALTPAGRP
ncbi:type I-E CRISPR-associated protein Cas7/Cse4/CasC [Streptomyces sp. INA 01156]